MKTSHLAAAVLLTLAAGAQAQTVGLHLVSKHIPAYQGQHNVNLGAYIRLDDGITLGAYHNTLGKRTFYVGETLERGPFAVTIGVASGYQRSKSVVPCSAAQSAIGYTTCYWQTAGTKGFLTPMLAPSVRLPAVLGVSPRITYMPGLAGSSNVFHLSVEHSF